MNEPDFLGKIEGLGYNFFLTTSGAVNQRSSVENAKKHHHSLNNLHNLCG